jgi:hypothetical protein
MHITSDVAFGLALWAFNFYAVGAVAPGARFIAQHEPTWLAIMTHVVYGLPVPPYDRRGRENHRLFNCYPNALVSVLRGRLMEDTQTGAGHPPCQVRPLPIKYTLQHITYSV